MRQANEAPGNKLFAFLLLVPERQVEREREGVLPGTLSEKEFCHAKNPEESFLSSRCNLLLFLGIYPQNVLI